MSELRKVKNRASAKASRNRKIAYTHQLKEKIAFLHAHLTSLIDENACIHRKLRSVCVSDSSVNGSSHLTTLVDEEREICCSKSNTATMSAMSEEWSEWILWDAHD